MTQWLLLALLALATPVAAYAQAFPIIVPFSAGGPTDTVTRLLSQSLSNRTTQAKPS